MKHKEILLAIIILFFYSKINAQTNKSPTQTVCQGSLLEPYLINPPSAGSSYAWSITGLGNNITPGSTSSSITIDWVNPGVYTLSVIETDADGCVGLPVLLEVTVDPLPTQTIANDESACVGGVIPDLTAIGSNVTWYADASLNNVVSTTNILSTGQTGVGIYTYYVTESLNGCEGPEISVDLEIYNSPSAPSAQDETTCFGSLIPDLTVIGSNVTWYSDASLTTVLSNNNNLNTNQTNAGSYDYYVTVTDANSCESSATSVNLEIYSAPITGPINHW